MAVEQSISRAGWDELVVVDRSDPEPLHTQLARGLRQALVDGRVPVGDRLPASRALAADMSFSTHCSWALVRPVDSATA